MNLRPFIFPILLLSLLFETTIITFPLVFICALVLYVLYPDSVSVIVGFVAGFLLDVLKLTPPGASSVAILSSFIIIELLKKGFELKDNRFVVVVIGILSFIYARTFSYMDGVILYIAIFGVSGFLINYFYNKSSWQK